MPTYKQLGVNQHSASDCNERHFVQTSMFFGTHFTLSGTEFELIVTANKGESDRVSKELTT